MDVSPAFLLFFLPMTNAKLTTLNLEKEKQIDIMSYHDTRCFSHKFDTVLPKYNTLMLYVSWVCRHTRFP